jgi:hypothetical protein
MKQGRKEWTLGCVARLSGSDVNYEIHVSVPDSKSVIHCFCCYLNNFTWSLSFLIGILVIYCEI